MTRPLVSIIVPSYNQGRYIRETIDSILEQDYRPLEVLVIDGASKDETVDVLKSYDAPELQWWSEPDKGVVDAVNKGLARAKGTILGIQSSDDLYLPGAINAAMEAFARDPSLSLVYGDTEYIDAKGNAFDRTNLPPFDFADYVGKLTYVPQASAFFTKDIADRVGPWRADVSYAADAEFFLRIAAKGRTLKIDRLLSRYRYHDEQRDSAGERIARDWEKAIRSWVATEKPPAALRRKASLGVHLTRAHYLPDKQWPRRTLELYRAALVSPGAVRDRNFPRRELIPGRTPIWKVLSRVKQGLRRTRTRAGALVYDWPRFLRHINGNWTHIRNRNERLTTDARGARCEWLYTSELHLANVHPKASSILLQRTLRDWPIVLRDHASNVSGAPAVSFLIGHRGTSRLQNLLQTLRSIAGQEGTSIECIVIEQSALPEVRDALPSWVRYIHTPVPATLDYCRAKTFNDGLRIARGEVLIAHDNDFLVPAAYAREVLARARDGYGFMDLKRFMFYPSQADTKAIFASGKLDPHMTATVVQNLKGGSVAATAEAYRAIGGYDESFVGWGGEDLEFWERARVYGRVYEFGYLPLVHLWHAPQPGKVQGDAAPAQQRYYELRAIPAEERIARLRSTNFSNEK